MSDATESVAESETESVKRLAREANRALFALEQALGSMEDNNPDLDLRKTCYRARCAVSEVAFVYVRRRK